MGENTEQLYQFIDKSGHCFKDYQNLEDDTDYHNIVGALLRASNDGDKTFTVGDMMCFRDELQEADFKWGVDFYIKKVED